MRQSELYLDPLPRPVYIAQEGEKIGFTRGVSLESEMEAERYYGPIRSMDMVILEQNFFCPKIRGACVYTKIWKESHRDPEAPRIVSSRDQLRTDQKQLIQMQNLGIGFLRTAPADDDKGYA